MKTDNNTPSKFDIIMHYLYAVVKIVNITLKLICVVALIFLIFSVVKFLSHFKQKETNIDNATYSSAMSSWSNGDYSKAEEQFLTAIDEVSKEYGEDNVHTAQVRQKLGSFYIEMTKYKDAVEQLNPAYVTFRKRLGDDDGLTIITKGLISVADIQMGNYEQGFRDLSDAYDHCTSIVYKLQIAQNLAQCYRDMGNYAKAVEWYDVLEDLYHFLYSDNDYGNLAFITFYNDRAVLYSDIGNSAMAIQDFESAKRYWMKEHKATELSDALIKGNGDQALSNILINEAMCIVQSQGSSDEATDCVNKALLICQNRFGENSSETARCYTVISGIYNALQDKQNEKIYLDKALDISLKTRGENSDLTASIYEAIAGYYSFWGDLETAVTYLEKSIDIRRNILDYEDFSTARMYENIANCKNNLLDFKGAEEAARTAVQICESLIGENSTKTADAYLVLSRPLINTDQYDEAQEFLNKVLDICHKYLPDGSTSEAFAYQFQMKMHLRQKKYDAALSEAETSLELFKKIQGESHSNTADATLFLGDVYAFLGNADKAGEMFASAAAVYENVLTSEIVHNKMDERVRKLIALESINTNGMTYQEIKNKVTELSDKVTDEQVKKKFFSWGFSF